ncbi:hypothetical protein J4438_00745 [Candidatus Woesearchaeota archaeon]|nr:hypothetical protein [Candidatus Woesearchaeota archaeon]
MQKTGYSKREVVEFNFESINLESNEFFGNSPPSVFVGRFGYPEVNVGVLSPVGSKENAYLMDSPKDWVKNNLKDYEIMKLRAQLINSRFKSSIKNFNNRLLDISQEVGMAYKPVEIEVELKNKPVSNLILNNITSPLSNNANVRNIKLTENPKIQTVVEKTVSDKDLKAVEGIKKLYTKGIDENFLSKILSVGLLGLGKNRKLVPTRWSITATDDTIGKELLKDIKFNDIIDHTRIYTGQYLGNFYCIMFFPGIFSYELFEMEVPFRKNLWSKTGKFYAYDYEDFNGRKSYANETAGGYYAARLGILEKLNELKRQGSVLVFRFINEEDRFPLGVWVCREATRKSLANNYLEFEDKNLALNYVKSLAKKKFNVELDELTSISKIINAKQKLLMDFI